MKKVIVKTRDELKKLIDNTIWKKGFECDLNFIDTSKVTNMYEIFQDSKFNGNISEWDTSNVTDMTSMFQNSRFNGDISEWDVGHVTDMSWMFYGSDFNGDISRWNVENVKYMAGTFRESEFNGDISGWNTRNVEDMFGMFLISRFNQDIGSWNVGKVKRMSHMFYGSDFNQDIGCWNTANVDSMSSMFYMSEFNQDISNWDVKKVTNYVYIDSLEMDEYKLPDKFRNQLIQSKSYIGWKKLRDGLICKLLIPKNAVKLKGISRNKCRASKAKVLDIIDPDGVSVDFGYSIYDPDFIYRVGEEIIPDNFNPDRWNECSGGIHFFLTEKEAKRY